MKKIIFILLLFTPFILKAGNNLPGNLYWNVDLGVGSILTNRFQNNAIREDGYSIPGSLFNPGITLGYQLGDTRSILSGIYTPVLHSEFMYNQKLYKYNGTGLLFPLMFKRRFSSIYESEISPFISLGIYYISNGSIKLLEPVSENIDPLIRNLGFSAYLGLDYRKPEDSSIFDFFLSGRMDLLGDNVKVFIYSIHVQYGFYIF